LDKLLFVNVAVFITVEHIVQLCSRVRVCLHPLRNLFQLHLYCLVESTVVLSVGLTWAPCLLVFFVPVFFESLKFEEGDGRGAARSTIA